jgi:SAM-dependent methyltransferase
MHDPCRPRVAADGTGGVALATARSPPVGPVPPNGAAADIVVYAMDMLTNTPARLSRRGHRLVILLLCAAAAVSIGLIVAVARGASWNLDVDRAMDAIGLAPGMVVGEAGAGDGYFTLPMARRVGPGGVVVANDISARTLRALEAQGRRDGLANITTVVGEVADPRFPRLDLQLVVIVHAFHDFSRPVDWLTNLKKYLRPGATVAVIDCDPAQGAESHFWPRERVIRYASEAGYELAKGVYDISDHLILVFKPRE